MEPAYPFLRAPMPIDAPTTPFQVKHREALHKELELLVAAGLSPVQALRSATALPAQWFELGDCGTVEAEAGRRADLLLVDGDPTNDISKTRVIRAVWIGGERVR